MKRENEVYFEYEKSNNFTEEKIFLSTIYSRISRGAMGPRTLDQLWAPQHGDPALFKSIKRVKYIKYKFNAS